MWISKKEYERLMRLERSNDSDVSDSLFEIKNKIYCLRDHLLDTCYGPWKVIHKVEHKDGTVIETAQRVVKKIKRD